jgi:hypothetical protein
MRSPTLDDSLTSKVGGKENACGFVVVKRHRIFIVVRYP